VIDFRQNKRVGLLAKIGRGSYSPAIVAQARPAEPRLERAQYLKWVRSVFVLWRHFVTDRLDLHRRDQRTDGGDDQPRDESGRWSSEGAAGYAKAAVSSHIGGLRAAVAYNAERAREYAKTSTGEDRAALLHEAKQNDRHVAALDRARVALHSGDTKLASHLLGKVGTGEFEAGDHHETTHLGHAEGSGEARAAEHTYIATHYGESLSLSDVLLNAHEAQPKPKNGRHDAPGDLLSVDWDQLIDSSGLEGLLDRIAKSIAARNQNYFAGIVKAQPPKIGTQADMIRQFRERNIGLIKSVGHDQIDQVNEVLARGNAAGLRHEEISAQIQERIGVSESRANLIARDQTLKYNSAIHTAQAAAAGIEEFTWSTSHDGAVRPYHKDLDGKVFRYDDPPVTNDDGDTNLPGEDYQCRCVAIPKISLFEGIDDSIDVRDAAEEPRDEQGRWSSVGGALGGRGIRTHNARVTLAAGNTALGERAQRSKAPSRLAQHPEAQKALAKLNSKDPYLHEIEVHEASRPTAGRAREAKHTKEAVRAGLATRSARKERLAKAASRYGEAVQRLKANAGQASPRKLVHLARKVATHARQVRRLAEHPAEAASYLYAARG
jgi:SPP1 gp7 family putative phage head morphogenesis protein